MLAGKVWGTTRAVLRSPFVSVDHLHILPQSRCSLHVHDHKANLFLVLTGRLSVIVEKNDYALVDVTELGPGQWTIVWPGEYHRFETGVDNAEAIEVYFPQPVGEDIRRKDVGGRSQG